MNSYRPKPTLQMLISGMITTPSQLSIIEVPTRRGIRVGITVKKNDYIFVIGRQAQTIQALQTIFRYAGFANRAGEVVMSVTEPGSFEPITRIQVPISSQWTDQQDAELAGLLERTVRECGFKDAVVVPKPVGNATVLDVKSKHPMPEDLQDALCKVFRAIANMSGRIVEMNIE